MLALWAAPPDASAHKLSDSHLALNVEGAIITGQWDMALRDLEHAITFDSDGDGKLTWGEVRRRHPEIEAYALQHLRLLADGEPCPASATEHLASRRADGVYAVLRFSATCSDPIAGLELGYALFFDLDPSHRGLLTLTRDGAVSQAVFSPDMPTHRFTFD